MNFRNIVKGLIVAVRNILLFLAGFIAFIRVIALILIVKSDAHIPDETFMKVVSFPHASVAPVRKFQRWCLQIIYYLLLYATSLPLRPGR